MNVRHAPPPANETDLLSRAHALAGLTLEQVAVLQGAALPTDLRRHKGWVGQLMEAALGADAASLAEPDFRALGVELKTLPVGRNGQPRESTYVCTVPLESGFGESWEQSWVRRKLSRVLWFPVEADPEIPLASRRLGSAWLWSPDPEQERKLRTDWEELMELVCLGGLETVSARLGEVLQIRPKAANASALTTAVGPEGEQVLTNPRGFYLRPTFTRSILARRFG